MRHYCIGLAVALGCLAICGGGRAAKCIDLVVDGKPVAKVVIGKNATPVERTAASELVRYVKSMSGATLKSAADVKDSVNRIVIGTPDTNPLVRALAKENNLVIDDSTLGADGYVIKTVGGGKKTLLLAGSSDRACLYAVYHLLSRVFHIGYFWDGVHIPESGSLSTPELDILRKSRWPVRQYNQGCTQTYNWMHFWTWEQCKNELEWAAWRGQNRIWWPLVRGEDVKTKGAEDYFAKCVGKTVDYAHGLGMEVIGVDHIYNVDPYPEQRISKDPVEEDRMMSEFARKTMADYKAKNPEAVWYTSGWALFLPGWRAETANVFFNSVGSDDFYISDVWGELHPIYKHYDYFYGRKWLFGILHSFGGNALMHGHIDDLVRRVRDVDTDPKADNCLGVYINPEINHYNDLYFDLASELAWNPKDFDMDVFLLDYSVRRYGEKSAAAMKPALDELRASVYGTNDCTPAQYQVRMSESFQSMIYDRIKYMPRLNKALGIALAQKKNQKDNLLYTRDLVDVAKQSLGELFNYHAITLYNAFVTGNQKGFDESATIMLDAMGHLESMLKTCEQYQIGAIMDSFRSIPGLTEEDITKAERVIKNEVFTFADRDDLRDYNHRDMLELVDSYYLPRVRVYIDHLRGQMSNGSTKIDKSRLTGGYSEIEKAWLEKPLKVMDVDNTWQGSVSAVENCLRWLKSREKMLDLGPRVSILNGDFESGNLDGWRVASTNTKLDVPRNQTQQGFYTLHFATGSEAGDHTFSLSQELRLGSKPPRIGVRYYIEECSPTANASLAVSGLDKTGAVKFRLVYFWGGDSWDHVRAEPKDTGGFYAASFKNDSALGEWHDLVILPKRDLDSTFGEGVYDGLGIDHMEIRLGCWTSPGEGQHVSGRVDEVTVVGTGAE